MEEESMIRILLWLAVVIALPVAFGIMPAPGAAQWSIHKVLDWKDCSPLIIFHKQVN
jgi:hypothetical protein